MNTQLLQEKQQRYKGYLAQDPHNQKLILDIGLLSAQILYHQHELDNAIELLEKLMNSNPKNADISGLLALIHFDNGDKIKAESHSTLALSINPSHYEGKTVQLLLKGIKNEANVDEIKALLSSNPEEGRLWYLLGTTYMQKMDFKGAENALTQSTRLWPYFYDHWICLGWCYLIQNQIENAENAYQNGINLNEKMADAWAGLSLIKALRNQIEEAHHHLQKATELDTNCFYSSLTRIILANQINSEEAAKQFIAAFSELINR